MEASSAVGPALDLVCFAVFHVFSHGPALGLSWPSAWSSKASEIKTSSAVGPALDPVCFAVFHVFSNSSALGLSWPSAWAVKASEMETSSALGPGWAWCVCGGI